MLCTSRLPKRGHTGATHNTRSNYWNTESDYNKDAFRTAYVIICAICIHNKKSRAFPHIHTNHRISYI